MSLLTLAAVVLLVPMLGIAAWNLASAPRLERAGEPRTRPRVSLLIPARNEAENLRVTLPPLLEELAGPRVTARISSECDRCPLKPICPVQAEGKVTTDVNA